VPLNPGNLSAYGLLTVDVRNDYVQTFVRRHHDVDEAELAAVFASLEERATAALSTEGFTTDDHLLARSADLRYYGQAFEVRVTAPTGPVDAGFSAEVRARFHDEHERLYGYSYRGAGSAGPQDKRDDDSQAVEWVNLRVAGIGPITRPEVEELPATDGDVTRALTGTRSVYFDGAWHDAALYERTVLRAGDVVRGPAVIEEFGSTLPLAPGFAGRVDERANLVVRRSEA
jgi:N-methylhydantoinase A